MFARLGSGCRAAATALALARAAASMLVKMDRSTTFRTGGADVPATTFASGHGHSSGWSLERSRRSTVGRQKFVMYAACRIAGVGSERPSEEALGEAHRCGLPPRYLRRFHVNPGGELGRARSGGGAGESEGNRELPRISESHLPVLDRMEGQILPLSKPHLLIWVVRRDAIVLRLDLAFEQRPRLSSVAGPAQPDANQPIPAELAHRHHAGRP